MSSSSLKLFGTTGLVFGFRYVKKNRANPDSVFYVGTDLSFQSVARQVFSAPMSLTSVFGMGTGGPSSLKAPTILFSAP